MDSLNKNRSGSFSSSYLDLRRFKQVRDNVHGYIYLDPIALKFVDTEQFQRLRDLKQLGLADMVYPGAVHSRFEHSLGVYYLAGEAVHKMKAQQDSDLGIDDLDIQAVKLAGLLHDVGHGPFCHLFEREFIPQVLNGFKWFHEDMSVKMIDYIVDTHHIEIDSECLKKSKEMVVASCGHASQERMNGKRFLYDIVANGRNGIDVDKFDYIVRDSRACGLGCNLEFKRLMDTMRIIDDDICYRAKDYLDVHNLFSIRADLHRRVYTHAKLKAIDLMVADALIKANEYLDIASSIHDPARFWKIDDSILKTIEVSEKQELKEARDLILRIRRRNLYQYCNEFAVPKDELDHFKEVTPQDVVCSQINGGVALKEEDVVVRTIKIDMTRGINNPLESVNFFQDYESNDKFPIPDYKISHLLPAFYQDKIVRVYSKKPELVEAVSMAFENYQEKMYGKKAQVHATPEKKKGRRLFP